MRISKKHGNVDFAGGWASVGQALLVLAQRYKNDISPQQREILKEVMRIHSHYRVTPEIRRELFS
ncbi:hypothetical protein T484DRAFT_1854169, partial [Baffinella frigidus]